jgi:hypothetical protein
LVRDEAASNEAGHPRSRCWALVSFDNLRKVVLGGIGRPGPSGGDRFLGGRSGWRSMGGRMMLSSAPYSVIDGA